MGPAPPSPLTAICQRPLPSRKEGRWVKSTGAGAYWAGVVLAHPLWLSKRKLWLQLGREGRGEDLGPPHTQSLNCVILLGGQRLVWRTTSTQVFLDTAQQGPPICPHQGTLRIRKKTGSYLGLSLQYSPIHHLLPSAPSIFLLLFLWHDADSVPGPLQVSSLTPPVNPQPCH